MPLPSPGADFCSCHHPDRGYGRSDPQAGSPRRSSFLLLFPHGMLLWRPGHLPRRTHRPPWGGHVGGLLGGSPSWGLSPRSDGLQTCGRHSWGAPTGHPLTGFQVTRERATAVGAQPARARGAAEGPACCVLPATKSRPFLLQPCETDTLVLNASGLEAWGAGNSGAPRGSWSPWPGDPPLGRERTAGDEPEH